MFGRATITLDIGPHSSYLSIHGTAFIFVTFFIFTVFIFKTSEKWHRNITKQQIKMTFLVHAKKRLINGVGQLIYYCSTKIISVSQVPSA